MATSDQPILIAGGGLGGLTTALALARRGRPVRVLEGAPEFGAIGYGIQFGPNVFHVFDRIGVSAEVLRVADEPPAVLMLDAFDGKQVACVPTGKNAGVATVPCGVDISPRRAAPSVASKRKEKTAGISVQATVPLGCPDASTAAVAAASALSKLPAGCQASSSVSSPLSNCVGLGGQPRICKSTGMTLETPPTTA